MALQAPVIKMVPVESDLFDAIGYVANGRKLYIKFRGKSAQCLDNVPGFRFEGLMNAPRKDAYYNTFIKNQFLAKDVTLPAPI
ncbi:MAG: KTSC domain-containing protein [Limisphaerales bacterium]